MADENKGVVIPFSADLSNVLSQVDALQKSVTDVDKKAGAASKTFNGMGRTIGHMFDSSVLKGVSEALSGIGRDLSGISGMSGKSPFVSYVKDVEKLSSKLNSVESRINKINKTGGSAAALRSAEYDYDDTLKNLLKVDELASGRLSASMEKLREAMSAVAGTTLPSKEFQRLESSIAKANEKMAALQQKLKDVKGAGLKDTSQAVQRVQSQINQTSTTIRELEAQKMALSAAGRDKVSGSATAEYRQLQAMYKEAERLSEESAARQVENFNKLTEYQARKSAEFAISSATSGVSILDPKTFQDAQKEIDRTAARVEKLSESMQRLYSSGKIHTDSFGNMQSESDALRQKLDGLYKDQISNLTNGIKTVEAEMSKLSHISLQSPDAAVLQERIGQLRAMLKGVKDEYDRVAAASGGVETQAMKELSGQAELLKSKLDECVAQYDRLMDSGGGKFSGVDTEAYARLAENLKKIQQQLIKTKDAVVKNVQGMSDSANLADQRASAIAQHKAELDAEAQAKASRAAQAKLDAEASRASERTASTFKHMWENIISAYRQGYEELSKIGGKAAGVAHGLGHAAVKAGDNFKSIGSNFSKQAEAMTGSVGVFRNLSSEMRELHGSSAISAAGFSALSGASNAFGTALSAVGVAAKGASIAITAVHVASKTAITVGKTAASVLTSGFRGFLSVTKGTLKALGLFPPKIKVTENAIKKLRQSFTSFYTMFMTRVKRMAVSFVFEDTKSNVGDMARIAAQFNNAVSGLIDSVRALGAQIVAILEPIVATFGPGLSKLIDMLTAAADKAAQFAARVTGNELYVKATKGSSDYAKSLDDTADSTRKANKAAKEYENTVLGFDQLHKLNGKKDVTGLGLDSATLSMAKTQVTALNDLADRIYKAFSSRDFLKGGRLLAEGVNEAFNWIGRVAGWTQNAKKFTSVLTDFKNTTNGFVSGLNPSVIGSSIGDVLNTLSHAVLQLTDPNTGIDFGEIGRKLGQTLGEMFKTIDARAAGTGFMQAMQGVSRYINGILSQSNLFEGLADFLIGSINSSVETFDPDELSDTISGLINSLFYFINRLFDKDAGIDFTNIGSKLGQTLLKSLQKTDWNEVGRGIALTFNALSSTIRGIIETEGLFDEVGASISDVFVGLFENLDDEAVRGVIQKTLDGVLATLQGVWNTTLSDGSTVGESIVNFIRSAFEGIDLGAISDILRNFGGILLTLMGIFTGNPVSIAIGTGLIMMPELVDFFSKVFDGIKSIGSAIYDGITWFVNKVIGVINWAIDLINKIPGVDIEHLDYAGGDRPNRANNDEDFQSRVASGNWDTVMEPPEGLADEWGTTMYGLSSSTYDAGADMSNSWNTTMSDVTTATGNAAAAMSTYAQEINRVFTNAKGHQTVILSPYNVNGYASGGVVGDGQLFIANENGAEMIGTDGGKTAVVNNNQIVSAITTAVKQAFLEAVLTMNNGNGGGESGDIVIYIGDEEVARASLRGQKKIDKRMNYSVAFN